MRIFPSVGLVSGLSWAWRALRGHSVTFAALFACGLFGLSIMGSIRRLLNRVDAPWYVWLFVPILAIGYLAKKEAQWIPDVAQRRKWSQRIFFGSIALALLLAFFRPDHPG